MERTLIGYRIRAKSGDGFVYLSSCGNVPNFPPFFWARRLSFDVLIRGKKEARDMLRFYKRGDRIHVDMNGDPIEISDPKIVVVYLRRNEP